MRRWLVMTRVREVRSHTCDTHTLTAPWWSPASCHFNILTAQIPQPPYLHLSETALELHSVLVVAAVQSDHPLVVADLAAALAVLREAGPEENFTQSSLIFRVSPTSPWLKAWWRTHRSPHTWPAPRPPRTSSSAPSPCWTPPWWCGSWWGASHRSSPEPACRRQSWGWGWGGPGRGGGRVQPSQGWVVRLWWCDDVAPGLRAGLAVVMLSHCDAVWWQ